MRAVALALLLAGFSAHATARRFDLTADAATNAEGELELEGWMDLGRPGPQVKGQQTNVMFWLGTRVGLLDNLELASFLVFEKRSTAAQPTALDLGDGNGLMQWATELRWRPVEVGKWPVDLFVQLQYIFWFDQFHPMQFRFTLGVSKQLGRFLFAGNFSTWIAPEIPGPVKPIVWRWLDASGGASVNLVEADGAVPSINLGVEAWSLIQIGDNPIHSHLLMDGGLVVGPTLSAARGRLWLTGHLGLPVFTPRSSAPGLGPTTPLVGRVMLGINLSRLGSRGAAVWRFDPSGCCATADVSPDGTLLL